MREKDAEKKGFTRREFIGKAFLPAVGLGVLSICFGRFLPGKKEEKREKPNISLKEASHYSNLAG